jgi:hypothetical protein
MRHVGLSSIIKRRELYSLRHLGRTGGAANTSQMVRLKIYTNCFGGQYLKACVMPVAESIDQNASAEWNSFERNRDSKEHDHAHRCTPIVKSVREEMWPTNQMRLGVPQV